MTLTERVVCLAPAGDDGHLTGEVGVVRGQTDGQDVGTVLHRVVQPQHRHVKPGCIWEREYRVKDK